jgi:hypothetical protein
VKVEHTDHRVQPHYDWLNFVVVSDKLIDGNRLARVCCGWRLAWSYEGAIDLPSLEVDNVGDMPRGK